MSKKLFFLALPIGLAFLLTGCHTFRRACHKKKFCSYQSLAGKAEINPVDKKGPSGTVTFQSAGKRKVAVTAVITGLPSNKQFGFHVHEWGHCGNKALMAGGHFNPWKSKHGGHKGKSRHLGDLGNLSSNERGEAFHNITVHGKAKKFFGRSVVIHAQKDDLTTQPTGNSGKRIACGVIAAAPVLTDKIRDKVKVKAVPYFKPQPKGMKQKSAALKGIQITFVEKGSVFDQMGFRKGDILKKIDGKPVAQDPRILKELENKKDFGNNKKSSQGNNFFLIINTQIIKKIGHKKDSGVKALIERDGKEMEHEYRLPSGTISANTLFTNKSSAAPVTGSAKTSTGSAKTVASKAVIPAAGQKAAKKPTAASAGKKAAKKPTAAAADKKATKKPTAAAADKKATKKPTPAAAADKKATKKPTPAAAGQKAAKKPTAAAADKKAAKKPTPAAAGKKAAKKPTAAAADKKAAKKPTAASADKAATKTATPAPADKAATKTATPAPATKQPSSGGETGKK